MDGVIVDTIQAICDLYNEDFSYYKNYKHVNACDINSWWFEELECTNREYINTYFNQPRFFNTLQFMPYAKEVIEMLDDKFDIYVVTMGYSPNLVGKGVWISKQLPNVKLVGCNFKDYEDKSHIDMSNGILVDDSSKNLITSNAKEKILFGDDYQWNNDWEGKIARNWIDLGEYLIRGE